MAILKSGKTLKDNNRIVIRLMGNFTPATAVLLLAVLGAGAYFLANGLKPWSDREFSISAFQEIFLSGEDTLFGLIPVFIGVVLTLFSIFSLLNMIRKINKPKPPRAFIFDNQQKRFLISMQKWNENNPQQDLSRLPGYNYSQLSSFYVRSYTVSRSGNDTSDVFSQQNRAYVVSVKKADGGFWDLFEAFTEESAKQSVSELEHAVNLDGAVSTSIPVEPLTARIKKFSSGGSVWFCWNKLSRSSGTVFLLFILAFSGVLIFFFSHNLHQKLILSAVFGFVFLITALKYLFSLLSVNLNYQCIRMSSDYLQIGKAPKSLFRDAKNSITSLSIPEILFKVQKQIDLRSIEHVQYDRRSNDDAQTHRFNFWTAKAGEAVKAMEASLSTTMGKTAVTSQNSSEIKFSSDSAAGSMPSFGEFVKESRNMFQVMEKMGKNIDQSTLNITLEGLTIGEAIGFERELEEEISRLGGHAD